MNPRIIGATIGLTVLAACGDAPTGPDGTAVDLDPDGDGILTTVDVCPMSPETINNVFDGDGCPDVPADLYNAVRTDVEAYWAAVFQGQGWTYAPVTAFLGYTSPLNSPCGVLEVNNAFYCGVNHGIYYHAPFLDDFLAQVGDAAPAFILAHEVGHSVGLGHLGWMPGVTLTSKQSELGADCFAGAWLGSASARGLLDVGDLEEVAATLVAIGDPAWTWFDPFAHGTAEQRVAAADVGLANGPWPCLPPPGDLTGWVAYDADGNGIWDNGEGVWQNVPVTVTSHWGETTTVHTDATGRWSVSQLPIGFAVVDIDESAFPPGVVRTFGTNPDTVHVVSGTVSDGGTHGYYQGAAHAASRRSEGRHPEGPAPVLIEYRSPGS